VTHLHLGLEEIVSVPAAEMVLVTMVWRSLVVLTAVAALQVALVAEALALDWSH